MANTDERKFLLEVIESNFNYNTSSAGFTIVEYCFIWRDSGLTEWFYKIFGRGKFSVLFAKAFPKLVLPKTPPSDILPFIPTSTIISVNNCKQLNTKELFVIVVLRSRSRWFANSYVLSIDSTNADKLNANEELLVNARKRLETPPDYDKIAMAWAVQLKKMDTKQQLFAKKAIHYILFEGQMGTLSRDSVQINLPMSRASTPLSGSLASPAYYDQNILRVS
ncbi:hypothetical protein J6590_061705 [Homalodisca vitripennis]|nr:hypothetical protein J6590_061705 [Homalodisca vitripennis]